MDLRIKNYIGLVSIGAIVVASFVLLWLVSSYSRSLEPSSFRSFSVSGEGDAVGIPDIAEFTFYVITEGGVDLGGLQNENIKKMNGAIAFIKTRGVDGKDIKTLSYNVQPRYTQCVRTFFQEETCPPPQIVGYTITQGVSVKVRDFSKVGEIMAGVVESGANSVTGLFFTIDDPTEIENEARAEAVEKARNKATALAKAGGFRLGRLLFIQEGGGISPLYFKESARALGVGGDSLPTPTIEPGSEEVTIHITLTYEIR